MTRSDNLIEGGLIHQCFLKFSQFSKAEKMMEQKPGFPFYTVIVRFPVQLPDAPPQQDNISVKRTENRINSLNYTRNP